MRTQLTTENETEGIYPSLGHATYCCGGVWWFLFCAWPQNPVLSLIISQQLSSYKPRNWQAFEDVTWERETGEIPCSRQKARRTITGWYAISITHKKVSPKDFLLDCAREDLNSAPAPASPEIMVTTVNYYNWCVYQNVLGGRELPGNSPVKSDSWKHITNINCICMLPKALWLMFALCVPASSVVPCRQDPRTCIKLPTKDLTKTKRADLLWICTCKSWKMSLQFTATTYNLCFNRFLFVGVSAVIFALRILCYHAKAPIEVEFAIGPEAGRGRNRAALTSCRLLSPRPLRSILGFKGCNHVLSKCWCWGS